MAQFRGLVAGAVTVWFAGTCAYAGSVTFTASSGDLAASATFTHSGSTLSLVIQNTATNQAANLAAVLHAVFFDISGGSPTLTPVSGVLHKFGQPGGSTIWRPDGAYNGTSDVGYHWAFESNLSGAPDNASYGVGSAGYNLFGAGSAKFGSVNQGGENQSPDGPPYGIVPMSQTSLGGGDFPMIKDAVELTWSISGLFDLAWLNNVSFQYGTSLGDANLDGTIVPLPPAAWMGLLGLVGVGVLRRRCFNPARRG